MTTLQPLNHFVTDLYSPEQTSLEVLQENIASLEWKSTLYSVLEKICYVALAAIMATAFAMSYNVIALSGVAAALVFLCAPIFIVAPTKFAELSDQHARLAETENRVALKLRDVQNWSIDQIHDFFRANRLDVTQVNQEMLRQASPQEPLRALLPLIARFSAMRDEVVEIQQKRREAMAEQEAHFARWEATQGRVIPIAEKQKVRFENECTHWANLELRAIPTAINAATVLQIIQNPTREDLDITPLSLTARSLTVLGLGHSEPKNYPERCFAKTYVPVGAPNGEVRDTYFVFNDPARAPITHQQIVDLNIEPHLLRPMLYV